MKARLIILFLMLGDCREIFRWELPDELLRKLSDFGSVLFVGGFVRDKIMGLSVSDQDILVCGISLEELCRTVSFYGKAEIVGRSFPVVKLYRGGRTYDFSVPTIRDHQSPRVEPGMSPEQDLLQRDFTINAIGYDVLSGKLVDPTFGINDLENKIIRVVSPDGFDADPLRIIRLCRLLAKLVFSPHPDTVNLAKSKSPFLRVVAPERIGEEFRKIMLLDNPSQAFVWLHSVGALRVILPELESCVGVTQPGGIHAYDVFEHTLKTMDYSSPDLLVRFSALFHDITKPLHRFVESDGRARFYGHQASSAAVAKKWLEKYAFSHQFAGDVARIVENHMFTHAETERGMRRFIRRVGKDLIEPIFQLRFADTKAQGMGGEIEAELEYYRKIRKIIEEKPPLGISDLALNGYDVMSVLRIPPGPLVGKALNMLLQCVLDDPDLNTRERLMNILEENRTRLNGNSEMGE